MYMHIRCNFFNRAADVDVVLSGVIGMYPALQAHLRCAKHAGLDRAALYFFQAQVIRLVTQAFGHLTL